MDSGKRLGNKTPCLILHVSMVRFFCHYSRTQRCRNGVKVNCQATVQVSLRVSFSTFSTHFGL